MEYVIGVDFGTLSARGVLLSETGNEVCVAEYVYPNKILTEDFFDGVKLLATDAFQHPGDYIEALGKVTNELIDKSEVSPENIKGIGVDFTSCTVLPVKSDGTPLCFLDEFKNNPHSYAKLWKHHSAQKEADEINVLAEKSGAKWMELCGGKMSGESFFPKIIETLRKAPQVYAAADRFVEAGDFIVWFLTGKENHSECMAGFKAMWSEHSGYPENSFWEQIDSRLNNLIGTKVGEDIFPVGSKAGEIDENASRITGLLAGTSVATAIIDAHASIPGGGITKAGTLMLILGTSTCHITLTEKGNRIRNISGSVDNGIIEGLCALEAGQSATGDSLNWFIENGVPERYTQQAKAEGKNIFSYLDEKASKIAPGENTVMALDWWGGNRTPYDNSELKGMIFGLNLNTKPEEIYRAMIEATAFGTKAIVDIYEKSGLGLNEIYVSGGIAKKNPMMMQIYADVLGKPIAIMSSSQLGARGSGVLAAAASGMFKDITQAAEALGDKKDKEYIPVRENTEKYSEMYRKYRELSEYFSKN